MPVNNFNFTKSWNSKEDFPTIETNEVKVRSDLQFLHDEVKNFINSVIVPALNANVSFGKLPTVSTVTEDTEKIPSSYAVFDAIRRAISGSGNVPTGGNENDFLIKLSDEDNDFGWSNAKDIIEYYFYDLLPVGTILHTKIPFDNSIPLYDKLALCNGDKIDSVEYPLLYQKTAADYESPNMVQAEVYANYKNCICIDSNKLFIYGNYNGSYNLSYSEDAGETFTNKKLGDSGDNIHCIKKIFANGNYVNAYVGSNGSSVFFGTFDGSFTETKKQLFDISENYSVGYCDIAYYDGAYYIIVNYNDNDDTFRYRLYSYNGTTVSIIESDSGSATQDHTSNLSVSIDGDYIGFCVCRNLTSQAQKIFEIKTYKTGESVISHQVFTYTGNLFLGNPRISFTDGSVSRPNGFYVYSESAHTVIKTFKNYSTISSKDSYSEMKDVLFDANSNTAYCYLSGSNGTKTAKFNIFENNILGYSEKDFYLSFDYFRFGENPCGIIEGNYSNKYYNAIKSLPMLSGKGTYYYIKAK